MQRWTLGLVLLAPAIPLVIVCKIFETKYSKVARVSQDQVGDLTTVVEESVLGIRIIKGFDATAARPWPSASCPGGCARRNWSRPGSWRASGR